jgi:SWI/SNF related-matrix-associated actin-dependent regulator of chromatin subfamily C
MNLCDLDWYITKESAIKNLNNNNNNSSFLICENCYEKNLFPNDLKKDDFELSNIFNIFEPNSKTTEKLSERIEKEKWTKEETKKLIDLIEKFGENWEEIEKHFEGKKTKADCIIHLMQLPIKENIQFKIMDNNLPKNEIDNGFNIKPNEINAINDQNNPLISQVVFFAKIFEKFINQDAQNHKEKNNNIELNKKNVDYSDTKNLRKLIYKTYAKTIDNSKKLIKNEKNEMKKYMDLLIYLQMKKIELKLNYFNEFEKMIEFKKNQIKTMESQIVQDRIKLSIKRNDLLNLISKIKESQKKNNNNFSNIEIENFQNQSDKLNNESNNQIIDIV